MARTYRRDARGRFAGGGYSGQSGGRGARLKGGGATRAGGGAKMTAARAPGSFAAGGPKSRPANRIKPTRGPLASPAKNNIRRLNVASKRNPLMAQSRQRMQNRIQRLGRNIKNLNRSVETRERIQSAANRGGGFISGREAKAYKKAERSAAVAANAFKFYQSPANRVAPSPRRRRGSGPAAPRRR